MAHSACKMHNPKFSYSQIKFPDGDIFGPDSFSLSEINWVHPFVGHFIQFHEKLKEEEKNIIFCQQTNNFVKSICFLLLEEQIFLFSRRKCFVPSQFGKMQNYIFQNISAFVERHTATAHIDGLPITLFAPF